MSTDTPKGFVHIPDCTCKGLGHRDDCRMYIGWVALERENARLKAALLHISKAPYSLASGSVSAFRLAEIANKALENSDE